MKSAVQYPMSNIKDHENLKILILNWRDPKHPLAGGAELSLFNQVKRWTKDNTIIWFAASFKGASSSEVLDGVRIIRKGSHFTVHIYAFYYYLTQKIKDVDVVIDSFHFVPFFTPLYIRHTTIVAVINEVAGKLWFSNIFYPFALIGYTLEPYFLKLYKERVFLTFSNSTKKELTKNGISDSLIFIVNHGVDEKKVSQKIQKEKKPTILFLNRISIDKGIIDFLKATRIVLQKDKGVNVWIVGKEEQEGMLSRLMDKYCTEFKKQIKYFGYVDENEKFNILKKAWLLIHTSQKEGWGLNVIEAANQGTPSIGYDVDGLRDSIINGKTGILSKPNPKDLAGSIHKLISDKVLIETMGENAYTWGTKFSWERSSADAWEVIMKAK